VKHQTLLRISLPGGMRIYPSAFREMLAKMPDLPNALFHRDDAGKTINTCPPAIRMAGAVGWVGLVAEPGSEQLLFSVMGSAVQAASTAIGKSCSIQVETIELNIKALNEPRVYWVREMAIKRQHKRAMEQDVETLIRERMLTSLEASCNSNGFVCPTADALGIEVVEIVHERGLRLQTTTGLTNMFVHLVDARVMVHADLDGMWFVGNLTSRGYGRIIQPRPGMRMESPRNAEFLQ
jgi:hypothetical protein